MVSFQAHWDIYLLNTRLKVVVVNLSNIINTSKYRVEGHNNIVQTNIWYVDDFETQWNIFFVYDCVENCLNRLMNNLTHFIWKICLTTCRVEAWTVCHPMHVCKFKVCFCNNISSVFSLSGSSSLFLFTYFFFSFFKDLSVFVRDVVF